MTEHENGAVETRTLPPGVYRRPGSRWLWIIYGHDGRLCRESAKTTRVRKAVALRAARLAALQAGTFTGPKQDRVTVAAVLDAYVAGRELAGVRSIVHITKRCAILREQFGGLRATALHLTHLQAWANQRLEAGEARGTVKLDLAYLRAAFTAANRADLTTARPHLPQIRVDNARQGFFEDHQVAAIVAFLRTSYRHGAVLADLVTLASFCGWRSQEVLGLLWAEVDRARGVVTLQAARSKNGKARSLPLVGPLAELIERRWAAWPKDRLCPWVFHRGGHRIRRFADAWKRACEAAGVPGRRFHDFRRTAARNLINAGVSEKAAMSITGHLSRQHFDRYHIVTTDDQVRALEALLATRAESNVVSFTAHSAAQGAAVPAASGGNG